jgi:hypothetical protein
VFPPIQKIANAGPVLLPDLWNLDPYLTVAVFSVMAVLLFYFIDRMGLQRKED